MSLHENQTLNHKIERYTFASQTAMTASTGYTVANIGQIAFISGDYTYWRLNAVDGSGNPTWVKLGGSGGTTINLQQGLVSYYRFDEASGTRMDSFGTNHLTVTGSGTAPGRSTGKIGSGYGMDIGGSGYQYLNASSSAIFPLSSDHSFTIGGWIYMRDTRNQNFWSKNQGSGNNCFQIRYSSNTLVLDASNPETQLAYSGTFSINTWHLIIGWYDHTAQTMYLQVDNGTVQSLSMASTPIINASVAWMGNNADAQTWIANAIFDGWFVYLRTLSTAERSAVWNSGNGVEIA